MQRIISVILVLFLATLAIIYLLQKETNNQEEMLFPSRTLMQQAGTYYQPVQPALKPTLTEIKQVWFPGANSIWGATGRDDQGHIWLGVSGKGETPPHLIEYDPELDSLVDHGDPVSTLRKLGINRNGEHQGKIHSKIIQMNDGWLYFSSMDETNEKPNGSQLPLWGSHFWRYSPKADRWEHLFSAPEGLVAVSGVGRWVYALGYWNHVLYQYDTQTGTTNRVIVGSEGGHASRNLIADKNGHVYVPRMNKINLKLQLTKGSAQTDSLLLVTLVEYDQHLNVVQTTKLDHYAAMGRPRTSHGITSLSYLADGAIIFGTHVGYLYKILPSATGAAEVTELGWLNPEGEAYNPVLFPMDGKRYIAGMTKHRGKGFQLFKYDLEQGESELLALDIPDYQQLLLYGSNTRDQQGRSYIVGRHAGKNPLLLQLQF